MRKYKGKTIRRKADGRWWVRFYDKNRKQRSVYGKTQNECLQNLKQAMKDDKQCQQNYKSMTFGEWIDKWLATYKTPKVKRSTLEQMQHYLKQITPIANIKLKNISAITMQKYLNSIEKPRKREKIHGFLKDAFTKAYKCRLVENNIFDAIESVPRQRKQIERRSREEEAILTEAWQTHEHGRFYLLCLYEGLRLCEATALTYEDIDWQRKTITVNKAMDHFNEITSPKTATSNRTILLFARTEKLLDRNGTGRIFAYMPRTYQNRLGEMCKRLNFRTIGVHSLRHTFATRCAEAGIPPKVVQKWLGHSTVNMTLNVYTRLDSSLSKKWLQNLTLILTLKKVIFLFLS